MSGVIDPRDVEIARVALFQGNRMAEEEIERLYSHPERVALEARYSPRFFERLANIMGAMRPAMLRAAMECAETPADRALIYQLTAEELL